MATDNQTESIIELKSKIIESETQRLLNENADTRSDLCKQSELLASKLNDIDNKINKEIEMIKNKINAYSNSILPENALYQACNSYKWLDAELMLKLKLVKNIDHTENGRTPLIIAISNRQIRLAKILIEAGANIEICDTVCLNTPLSLTASCNLPEITELLIKFGANLNVQNINNNTPLFRCLLNYPFSLKVFELLINAGADIDIKCENNLVVKDKLKSHNIDKKYLDMLENLEKKQKEAKNKLAEKLQLEEAAEAAEKIRLEAKLKLDAKNKKKLAKENQQQELMKKILFENSSQVIELKKCLDDYEIKYQEKLSEVSELKNQIAKLEKILSDTKSTLQCVDSN